MRKIKVGLVQQKNTADIRLNMERLSESISNCASQGAQLVVLQELHNSLYFCQTENTDLFDLVHDEKVYRAVKLSQSGLRVTARCQYKGPLSDY